MPKINLTDGDLAEINTEIQEIEFHLKELNPGMGAEVPLGERAGTSIGYGKICRRWVLYFKTPNGHCSDLIKAGRLIKLLAIVRLPVLLDALLNNADKLDEVNEDPLAAIRDFREKLENMAAACKESEA